MVKPEVGVDIMKREMAAEAAFILRQCIIIIIIIKYKTHAAPSGRLRHRAGGRVNQVGK